VHRGGGLKLRLIGPSFAAAVAPLRGIRELSALPATNDVAADQAARLLREPRSGTHPLRHLALILWLFGTWATFWDAYQGQQSAPGNRSDDTPAPQTNLSTEEIGDPREATLVRMLRNERCSISRAAARIGVDSATAMVWAARGGIATPRRPKILKEPIRRRLIDDLKCGHEKHLLAEKYAVSIQTITTTLRTEVGLHNAWKAARRARACRAAQSELSTLADKHSAAGIGELRLLAPAAYGWLYRNNRAWLSDFRRGLSPAPRGNNVAVDWDTRDEVLATQIREEALRLSKELSRERIPLWRLCQTLPELKAKLGALNHLPLTLRALQEVTRRRARRMKTGLLL